MPKPEDAAVRLVAWGTVFDVSGANGGSGIGGLIRVRHDDIDRGLHVVEHTLKIGRLHFVAEERERHGLDVPGKGNV